MINIGIIGFGTVGTGTAKILLRNKKLIQERTGVALNLKKIADLNITNNRGLSLPANVMTKNAGELLKDPDIKIIV